VGLQGVSAREQSALSGGAAVSVIDLEARRLRVGGSEAASACGVDPFRSRIALWAEKTGRIERPESPAMRLGTLLQPAAAALVEGEGYEVMPAPEDGFTHPEHGFMVGHLDGFTVIDGGRAVLEIKTRGTGWKDDARALAGATMQAQHYMNLMTSESALIAVLHGGYGGLALDLRIVRRDDALIALMVELEREFVELVRSDTPPDPDGSDSAREAVRAMAGEAEPGKTVRATPEVWKLVKTIRECDERIAAIKAQREQAAQTVQAFMGDAEELVTPFDTPAARWPTSTRTSLDTKALKAAHPSIAGEFTKATTYRTFNANPAERKR
jgi:putative phage-type endonuclease